MNILEIQRLKWTKISRIKIIFKQWGKTIFFKRNNNKREIEGRLLTQISVNEGPGGEKKQWHMAKSQPMVKS